MTFKDHILIAVLIAIAAGFYFWLGRPGMPEQPFAERAAEIAAADPSTLSPDELLARLQAVAQERPTEPEPHYHIAVLLRTTGRPEDAVRAFQSALRRDDRHVPSLVALADLLTVENQGEIGEMATQLYDRAWRLDATQVRSGFMAGLEAYRAGRDDEANARWQAIEEQLAADDPKRGMLAAMISAAEEERLTQEETP
jgi:cytochrome c-type biogenesis protein CcmH